MEHRYSRRQDIDLKVLIYKRGFPVAAGRIKNGSNQGLFVATDYTNVSPHQKLKLVVIVKRTPRSPKHYHLNTLVVHKTPTGLGLELEHHSEDPKLSEMVSLASRPPVDKSSHAQQQG